MGLTGVQEAQGQEAQAREAHDRQAQDREAQDQEEQGQEEELSKIFKARIMRERDDIPGSDCNNITSGRNTGAVIPW